MGPKKPLQSERYFDNHYNLDCPFSFFVVPDTGMGVKLLHMPLTVFYPALI